MIARVCAAEVARQIVRALHIPAVEQPVRPEVATAATKRKATKPRKKRKAA